MKVINEEQDNIESILSELQLKREEMELRNGVKPLRYTVRYIGHHENKRTKDETKQE